MHRRTFLAATISAAVAPAWCRGQDTSPAALMDDKTHAAIERGLAFLASRQNDAGSFGTGGYPVNVAVVALAGLAFMSRGNTPGRGPYGVQVARCLDYILQHTEQSGFIHAPAFSGQGPMYGHGFATLLLAEAFGMSSDPRVRDRLTRAVKLIIDTQNDEGGWRYEPQKFEADISVTICQIMALRAARNCGIYVPNATVDKCIEYVKRCQNPDGGFMYMLSQPGISEFPRSAAGVVALYSAGIYEGPEIEKGLKYLWDHAPHRKPQGGESYFFYGQYYAAQAMYQAGDTHWARWYPAIKTDLLGRQNRTTSDWFDTVCPEYGTAMACLVLQMPNSYLPIFQR